MSGDIPARRRGASSLVGTNEADNEAISRVYTNRVNALETGPGMGQVSFTRDANGRITSFSEEFDRPDGTVTVTWTFTRRDDNLATSISEGVVS